MSGLETQFVESFTQLFGVELAVLFGSHARGAARPGSDVDVAIRLSDDSPEETRGVELALGRAAGRDVDVVPLDASPPLLRFEIAREGKVLLERALS